MRASLLRVRASTQTFIIHTFTYTNSTHANFFQFYLLGHQNGFNKYKKKKKKPGAPTLQVSKTDKLASSHMTCMAYQNDKRTQKDGHKNRSASIKQRHKS